MGESLVFNWQQGLSIGRKEDVAHDERWPLAQLKLTTSLLVHAWSDNQDRVLPNGQMAVPSSRRIELSLSWACLSIILAR